MSQEAVSMDFPNGQQLAAALRELPEAVRGEILATALVAGAQPIKEDAQVRAAVHRWPRRRPEAVPLAETIKTEVKFVRPLSATVDVKTNDPKAHLVELGHALVRGDKTVGHVPAHPFLRPAADEHAEQAVAIIGEMLGREIEDAFRKQAPHEAS